jgi:hypothetical protein
MNLHQRYNLLRAKWALAPSGQFKIALLRKLTARMNQPVAWYQVSWVRFSYTVVSGILIVASVSASAYAYTSPKVVVGTPLYTIKQGLEKIEEKTKVTPEQKAQFLLKTIQRREAEKETLERDNKDIEAVENQIESVARKLHQVSDSMASTTVKSDLQHEVVNRLEKQEKHWANRQEKLMLHQKEVEDKFKEESDKISSSSTVKQTDSNESEDRSAVETKNNKLKIERESNTSDYIKSDSERTQDENDD